MRLSAPPPTPAAGASRDKIAFRRDTQLEQPVFAPQIGLGERRTCPRRFDLGPERRGFTAFDHGDHLAARDGVAQIAVECDDATANRCGDHLCPLRIALDRGRERQRAAAGGQDPDNLDARSLDLRCGQRDDAFLAFAFSMGGFVAAMIIPGLRTGFRGLAVVGGILAT